MLTTEQVDVFLRTVVGKKLFLEGIMKEGEYFIPNGIYQPDSPDFIFWGKDEKGALAKWYVDDGFLVWRVLEDQPLVKSKTCTCGAKHTSNPRYHLGYCDLNKDK